MRRTVLALGGTAAGLAALLSFKTHMVSDASAGSTPAAMTSPTTAAGTGKGTGTGTGTGKGTAATKTFTGKVDDTQYGPMQVQIVLTGKKITKVNVVQQTDTGVTSIQVDTMALPKLKSETLTAQSARVDAVSGATYTSAGYIKSLQSAVDMSRA